MTSCVIEKDFDRRRRVLLEKAPKIPDAKALEIILRSFPEQKRTGLLEQVKPLLKFSLE